MKRSAQIPKPKRQKHERRSQQTEPRSDQPKRGMSGIWRWALVAVLGLLLAGGGTWAVLELFFWNNLPAGLVGKWEVQGGPMRGGTFEFFRTGTLEIKFHKPGTDVSFKAHVVAEDKTLLTTTQNTLTRQDETRKNTIRELTENSLILELENGDVLKMLRKQ